MLSRSARLTAFRGAGPGLKPTTRFFATACSRSRYLRRAGRLRPGPRVGGDGDSRSSRRAALVRCGRGCRPVRILAIDQGTTGTMCLVVDEMLRTLGRGYCEITQHFPGPGWVEHDPEEIWASVERAVAEALAAAGIRAGDLSAIGITNQRETTVVWDQTLRPARPPGHRMARPPYRRSLPDAAGGAASGTNRARPGPVLLRHEAGMDPRAHRAAAEAARLRHGRHVADLEADGRRGACHRCDQRVADDARRPGHRAVGRRAPGPLLRRAVHASRRRSLVGHRRRGVAVRRDRPGCGHCR